MIEIPDASLQDWLSGLKKYQREQISALLKTEDEADVLLAARSWTEATGAEAMQGFGGSAEKTKIFDELLAEFTKLICGKDQEYEADRKRILSVLGTASSKTGALQGVVLLISNLIAAKLGVVAAFLVTPTTLLLFIAGKVGVRAWCKSRGCPL